MTDKRVTCSRTESEGAVVLKIEGTFNRRISESEFDEVAADLSPRSPPGQLVINISDIAALDSKGEGKIEDAMADTLANGGRAALIIDPGRRWLYVSLEAIDVAASAD